ncbi:MAG: FmdB family transcriptional regulator [Chloroflexota bacterium]|nr:FmdB family transcriptional regulator [Chloroflexota bacterium]MDE2684073.1 FmdB family transcriptional regulator [Chloroflexota bacterium]
MPRYVYRCTACDHEYDRRESFAASAQRECPECSGLARRVFHPVPVIYKGSGFYTTDYARKKSPATA